MESKSGIINTDLKVKGLVSENYFFNHIDSVTDTDFIKYPRQYYRELLTKNKFLAKEYDAIENESGLLLK